MNKHLRQTLAESPDLATVLTASKGPRVGDAKALLMTIDMAKMLEATGQETTAEAKALTRTIYGDTMAAAMSTAGGYVVAAGGDAAIDRLRAVAAGVEGPGSAPSFAPLDDGPGFSMCLNLGRFLSGLEDTVPEAQGALEGPAEALSGNAGRVPMGVRFDPEAISFELAVPLDTIETVATLARERKAKAAAEADATPAPEPEGE
jgi:hypothetical protein